jgi:hypothetical protein
LLPKNRQHQTTQSIRAFSDSNAWNSSQDSSKRPSPVQDKFCKNATPLCGKESPVYECGFPANTPHHQKVYAVVLRITMSGKRRHSA